MQEWPASTKQSLGF